MGRYLPPHPLRVSALLLVAIPSSHEVYQRTFSRTIFKVLGLEASSPQKLPCPRLEDSTFFDLLKMGHGHDLLFTLLWKTAESSGKTCEDLFFMRSPEKKFEDLVFRRTLAPVSFGPWPWPRAFLSLVSRGCVLEKSVLGLGLGLGFFCVLGLVPCVLDSTSMIYHQQISIDTILTKTLLPFQILSFYIQWFWSYGIHTKSCNNKKKKKKQKKYKSRNSNVFNVGIETTSHSVQNPKLLFSSSSYLRSVRLFKARISFSV